jgi:hypothetical protein
MHKIVSNDYITYSYNSNNNLHSFNDNPAVYSKDGKVKKWYKNGILHRDEGPADIFITNTSKRFSYYKDGEFHRIGAPASIYIVDGIVCELVYYLNGKEHNPVGPSYIYYHSRGVDTEYFFNDVPINKDLFFKKLEERLGIKLK